MKLKLLEHIQNLRYQEFYENSLVDLVQNMADDVNNIVGFIKKQFTYILDIVLMTIFAITQLVNLDLEFEKNVMEANKVILKDKISFVIAHRINTVKDADLIILIEDKKIIEMKRHEELIQKQGYYYNLYMSKETMKEQSEIA